MRLLLAAVAGYCIGSISWAVIVGRIAAGIDVREHGSGTAGGANIGRLLGFGYGALVTCCDAVKGVAAALVGQVIGGASGQMASGAAAVLGHMLPLWFGFAGGKAIATFFGSCLLTAPAAVLPAGALWLGLRLALHSVPRASAIAAACLPLIGRVCGLSRPRILYLGVMGAVICLRHIPDALAPGSGRRARGRGLVALALGIGLCLAMPLGTPAVAGAIADAAGDAMADAMADADEPVLVRVGIVGLPAQVTLGSSSGDTLLRIGGGPEMPVAVFEPDAASGIACISPDGMRVCFEGSVGVEVVAVGSGSARDSDASLIWLGSPADVFRGRFELVRGESGEMYTVNILSLEDYVAGVVPYEIGAGAPQEALRAQAVVCRTEALELSARHGEEPFAICSSTHCQVYRGAAAELAQLDVRRAVDSTRGEVLFYDGRPAPCAKYHACCGGVTESAEAVWRFDVPYMRGVHCCASAAQEDLPVDGEVGDDAIRDEASLRAVIAAPNELDFCYGSNGYRWRADYTAGQLATILEPIIGRLEPSRSWIISIAVIERTPRGSALRVRVTTTEGEYDVAGEYAIRAALGGTVAIKSGVFVVDSEGDPPAAFVFSGAGYGHGVGMCQYGARAMARAGYSYRAILEHYYPGTMVEFPFRSAGD